MKLYIRCQDCLELFELAELHHIGLRWWLCESCDARWSYEELQTALSAPDNRCMFHNVYACEDCYPERYLDADGRTVPIAIAESALLEQQKECEWPATRRRSSRSMCSTGTGGPFAQHLYSPRRQRPEQLTATSTWKLQLSTRTRIARANTMSNCIWLVRRTMLHFVSSGEARPTMP